MVVYDVGDNVRAKFMATKMGPFGTKFLPGVISKVHPDPGKKHDLYRYDINYENGKFEANVKAQFVKEPLAGAAGAVAPTPRPELAPEAKQQEPKSVHKEVKPVAAQATPAAKPEPKSAQKASAGPTDDSGSKRESKLNKASPDGSDAEFAAKPSKAAAAASAAGSGRPEASASASASSNKRVRKQVDYNAAEESSEDESEEEDAAASKSARASASKGKGSKPKKAVAESESEEYEQPSSEGSGDEESEAEAESEPESEDVPKKKPAKAAPKPAARKPAARKAVAKAAAPARKTKKPASPEADSASEEGSDEEEEEEDDDDAFDEEKAPVKKAAKARSAARPKGGAAYEKSKWSEEEIAELPVLTKPQEMFDDMVAQAEARASTHGSALEGHSLAALAERLDGRKLRVATM